jgi:hypothetical protein
MHFVFSLGARGCVFGGGPIAVVQDGDVIEVDIPNRRLSVDLSEETLDSRLETWEQPEKQYPGGVLGRYGYAFDSAANGAVTDEMIEALGVAGTAGVVGEITLGEIRSEVATATSDELAAMGEAIRSDLTGSVDASLLASGMSGIAASIEELQALEAAGIPTEQGTASQSLTDEAWTIHEHLVEIGFFSSAEEHLPPFVPEHISATARELVGSGALADGLSTIGVETSELTAVATTDVNKDAHLAKWKPIDAYPPGKVDEFDPADVAPLHQRATEGTLLWIDGLDHWLWQNKILVTEEMLADGIWDVKTMLGAYYLVSQAAHDVAEGAISDELLTAMVTTGSAASIVGQEHLAFDLIRVSDEMRAPRGGA